MKFCSTHIMKGSTLRFRFISIVFLSFLVLETIVFTRQSSSQEDPYEQQQQDVYEQQQDTYQQQQQDSYEQQQDAYQQQQQDSYEQQQDAYQQQQQDAYEQQQQDAAAQQQEAAQQQLEAERQRTLEAERQRVYEAQQAQQELDQQRQLDEINRNAAEQQQQQTDEATRRAYDQLQEQQNQQLKDRQQRNDAELQRKVQNDQYYYDQLRRDEQQEAQEQQNQDLLDRQNEEYDRRRAEQEQRDRESAVQEEEDDVRNSPTVPESNDGSVDGEAEVVYVTCEDVESYLAQKGTSADAGECDFPEADQIKWVSETEKKNTLFNADILERLLLASRKNNDCYVEDVAGGQWYRYFEELFGKKGARYDICGEKGAEIIDPMPTVAGLYNKSHEYKTRMEAVLLKLGLPLVRGTKTGYEFHHRIPKKYNQPKYAIIINDQREVDFDYHAPANIRIVPRAVHLQISDEWKKFDNNHLNATWDEINAFADQLDLEYGQYYLYKFLY
jgi:hypothetical protein